jgi:hypothetical protein
MKRFRCIEIRPDGMHIHLLPNDMSGREMQTFAAVIPYPTRLEMEVSPHRWEPFTLYDGRDYWDTTATLARMRAEAGEEGIAP